MSDKRRVLDPCDVQSLSIRAACSSDMSAHPFHLTPLHLDPASLACRVTPPSLAPAPCPPMPVLPIYLNGHTVDDSSASGKASGNTLMYCSIANLPPGSSLYWWVHLCVSSVLRLGAKSSCFSCFHPPSLTLIPSHRPLCLAAGSPWFSSSCSRGMSYGCCRCIRR